MKSIDELLHDALYIGVDRIIYPIDIFELSNEIANHPKAHTVVEQLAEMLEDPENSFTRFVAIGALKRLGKDVLAPLGGELTKLLLSEGPLHAPARAEAARCLGIRGIADKPALSALETAMRHCDEQYVIDACREALAQLEAEHTS